MTPQQHRLLVYLDETIRKTGICPSYAEMAAHMGLVSKSGIHRLVTALAADGYVIYKAERQRSLEVARRPWDQGVVFTREEWDGLRTFLIKLRETTSFGPYETFISCVLAAHP